MQIFAIKILHLKPINNKKQNTNVIMYKWNTRTSSVEEIENETQSDDYDNGEVADNEDNDNYDADDVNDDGGI